MQNFSLHFILLISSKCILAVFFLQMNKMTLVILELVLKLSIYGFILISIWFCCYGLYFRFFIRQWKFDVEFWTWFRIGRCPYFALFFWVHCTPLLALEIISKFFAIHHHSMRPVASRGVGILLFDWLWIICLF